MNDGISNAPYQKVENAQRIQRFSNNWWEEKVKWLHTNHYLKLLKEQEQQLVCDRYKGRMYIGSIPLGSHDQICNPLANNATSKANYSIQNTLETELVNQQL